MPNLDGVVTIINSALQTGQFSSRRFQPSKYYGIADNVKIIESEHERTEPNIISNDGEGVSLAFDDNNAMQVYHQCDNIEFSVPDLDYGKPGTTVKEAADMRIILIGNRALMQTDERNCSAALAIDFPKEFLPSQITSLGMNTCVVEMGSVELNPYVNWEQEFPGTVFGLSNNTVFIAMKYRIISEYNKECFSICN